MTTDAEPPTRAVARARDAQPRWAARSVGERLDPVRALRTAIGDDPQPLVAALAGLDRPDAVESLSAELLPLADACRYLEREAREVLAPRRLGRTGRPLWLAGVRAEVRREPFGVVLVVGPSNYPLLLPGVQAVQGLVAGNAVLWKPGRGGGPAAWAVASALARGGLPAGLLAVLDETPDAAIEAIEAGVDKVVLTGSAATGASVLARLAPRLVPSALELSGCDAVFVREDADPALVVRAVAFGLRLNGSATCLAPRRIFAARSLLTAIERGLVEACGALPARRVEPGARDRAIALARDAVDRGARLLAGSLEAVERMAPIVLADARPDMALLASDVFAPVAAIVPVVDDDAAIAAAAACPYALGVSIFGAARGARELAARVHAGSVTINDLIVPTADPRLPFGGRGRSGFGATRGAEGLLEMTAAKTISERAGRFHPHLAPPDPGDAALFTSWLQAAHGSGRLQRLRAGARLVAMLMTRSAPARTAATEGRR